MTDSQIEFYWAQIGDSGPEPVAVKRDAEGRRLAYTCGCADPFVLDQPDSVAVLIARPGEDGYSATPGMDPITPLQAPATPVARMAAAEEREHQIQRDLARGIPHRWQRFGDRRADHGA